MAKSIQTEIIINATPERVWSVLTDFKNFPAWNPFIKSIEGEVIVGKKISVKIQPPAMRAMTFNPTVLTYNENHEFSWIGYVFGKGVFDGKHRFELIPLENNRTLLRHSEVFSGLLVPLLWRKMYANTRLGFEQMNAVLKYLSETK